MAIAPLADLSADPGLLPLSRAIEATPTSALVRMNPGTISTQHTLPGVASPSVVVESKVVMSDAGPALVVRLQDTGSRVYVWSNAYLLSEAHPAPNLVEQIASDMTAALHWT